MEACGGHGTCRNTRADVLIMRHADSKETWRLEIKLGEINEEKVKIEFAQ